MSANLFVKISLLLHVITGSSYGLDSDYQNFQVQRSKQIPKCTYSGYVYDPAVDSCAEAGTQAHCGENMTLTMTGTSSEGSCVCRNEVDRPCWGRPQILSRDKARCWNLGQRVRPNPTTILRSV